MAREALERVLNVARNELEVEKYRLHVRRARVHCMQSRWRLRAVAIHKGHAAGGTMESILIGTPLYFAPRYERSSIPYDCAV
eukprot:COSAG02_NODE_2658_length_8313_cov_3.830411_7_plen_82_part_00